MNIGKAYTWIAFGLGIQAGLVGCGDGDVRPDASAGAPSAGAPSTAGQGQGGEPSGGAPQGSSGEGTSGTAGEDQGTGGPGGMQSGGAGGAAGTTDDGGAAGTPSSDTGGQATGGQPATGGLGPLGGGGTGAVPETGGQGPLGGGGAGGEPETGGQGPLGGGGAGGAAGEGNVVDCVDATGPRAYKQIAVIPPTDGVSPQYVDGMDLLEDGSTLLVGTTNEGALCGSGTPAAVWNVALNPETGIATSVEFVQSLDLIQHLRLSLFESSDGTVFTGGGWCGATPPYYSVDAGLTFSPANVDDYPPNSSFAYAEFQGEVYLGTGYEPYHGEVYRWLGDGSWTRVLDIAPPRGVANAMVVGSDRLFVGTDMYGWEPTGCETSVPVYSSSNGATFEPTTGIPGCNQVLAFAVTSNRTFAFTQQGTAGAYEVYGWNSTESSWELVAPYPHGLPQRHLISTHGSKIYVYPEAPPEDVPTGIYSSEDGISWEMVTPIGTAIGTPLVSQIVVSGDTLYAGTQALDSTAYVYSLGLCP